MDDFAAYLDAVGQREVQKLAAANSALFRNLLTPERASLIADLVANDPYHTYTSAHIRDAEIEKIECIWRRRAEKRRAEVRALMEDARDD